MEVGRSLAAPHHHGSSGAGQPNAFHRHYEQGKTQGIIIDYLRNDLTSTAASIFDGATNAGVSPLFCKELNAKLVPGDYPDGLSRRRSIHGGLFPDAAGTDTRKKCVP